jgi:hypothetical protein
MARLMGTTLTNAVAPNSIRRTLLLTGMAGFLVMAPAIRRASSGAYRPTFPTDCLTNHCPKARRRARW